MKLVEIESRGAQMIEQGPSPELLVVGGLTVDLIDVELVPGGSVLYATQAAAALGVSVQVLTARGDEGRRELASAGCGRSPKSRSSRRLGRSASSTTGRARDGA